MLIRWPEIMYNYPVNGTNPFDLESYDKYFVFASGFSKLSGDWNAFNYEKLVSNFPQGYRTIIICERMAVLSVDGICGMWNSSEVFDTEDEFCGKFFLSTNIEVEEFIPSWDQVKKTYALTKPGTDRLYIGNFVWESFEEAEAFASDFCVHKPNVAILISRIINTLPWH